MTVFKYFIKRHLSHVGKYTGVALKNEPAIMGWETGNELSYLNYIAKDGPPPVSWTTEIARYVKSIDKNHLIIDGTYGLYPSTGQLNVTDIDIFSDHFYPLNATRLKTGSLAVKAVNRHYLAGEIDWTEQYGGTPLNTFFAAVEQTNYIGDLFWSMFGHTLDGTKTQCCNFVEHADGYSLYYPGRSTGMQGQVLKIAQHYARVTGAKVPTTISDLPAVACPLPLP